MILQNNWEAVKALALDTSRAQQQLLTSPSQDIQSIAQVGAADRAFEQTVNLVSEQVYYAVAHRPSLTDTHRL